MIIMETSGTYQVQAYLDEAQLITNKISALVTEREALFGKSRELLEAIEKVNLG